MFRLIQKQDFGNGKACDTDLFPCSVNFKGQVLNTALKWNIHAAGIAANENISSILDVLISTAAARGEHQAAHSDMLPRFVEGGPSATSV